MLAVITEKLNNTNITLEFIANKRGCALDLSLSGAAKSIAKFIDKYEGAESFILVGGKKAAGQSSPTKPFTVCATEDSNACFEFTLSFGY